MVFGKTSEENDAKVNIDGQAIESVKNIFYILKASLHGIMTVPRHTKITLATAVYSELQSIWKDSGIMIHVNLQRLRTIVFFPVLLYAAETWTVNKEDGKKTTCI